MKMILDKFKFHQSIVKGVDGNSCTIDNSLAGWRPNYKLWTITDLYHKKSFRAVIVRRNTPNPSFALYGPYCMECSDIDFFGHKVVNRKLPPVNAGSILALKELFIGQLSKTGKAYCYNDCGNRIKFKV